MSAPTLLIHIYFRGSSSTEAGRGRYRNVCPGSVSAMLPATDYRKRLPCRSSTSATSCIHPHRAVTLLSRPDGRVYG
jgi:hypothetical protein